jgi:hypothetical protein
LRKALAKWNPCCFSVDFYPAGQVHEYTAKQIAESNGNGTRPRRRQFRKPQTIGKPLLTHEELPTDPQSAIEAQGGACIFITGKALARDTDLHSKLGLRESQMLPHFPETRADRPLFVGQTCADNASFWRHWGAA